MENKHPSEWTELPEGVYPVRFMVKGDKGDSDVYDVTSPRHAVWKKCPKKLERWKNNDRVSIGWSDFYKAEKVRYALLTMVEFNNGWIWEAGGRGWRLKDGAEHTSECDHDCVHCNDDCGCDCDDCIRLVDEAWSRLDPDESPEPLIIPLREKVYGRDTHAALMDAHRKREQAAQWTEGRTRKLLSDSGTDYTISCLMRSIGDELTYDGVEEK